MYKSAGVLGTLVVLLLATGGATVAAAQEVGPANGSLVVVGGGLRDLTIVEEFVELAGGPDAPIVVIPTAGGRDEYDQYCYCLRQLREVGATNLTVLHTKDRGEADSDDFVAVLKEARGVWFSGGRQWRLADSYLGTKVEDELWGLLERGGVIGGSSAGATIQGSYLVRGDTETNTIMMGDHEEGFGFLRDVAIDQHLLKRNRQFDLIEVIEARPELLGIGLDENTAIVVRGNSFRVDGASYVAIYDHGHRLDSGGLFYFLAPGDRYNMQTREAFRMRTTAEPLEGVVEEVWPQR
ncbi:MAG: cyanophycinase [Gemmatimonadota bacterium]|nr:MAG: cyanophycinase [Gemmatimonadota bacterium]